MNTNDIINALRTLNRDELLRVIISALKILERGDLLRVLTDALKNLERVGLLRVKQAVDDKLRYTADDDILNLRKIVTTALRSFSVGVKPKWHKCPRPMIRTAEDALLEIFDRAKVPNKRKARVAAVTFLVNLAIIRINKFGKVPDAQRVIEALTNPGALLDDGFPGYGAALLPMIFKRVAMGGTGDLQAMMAEAEPVQHARPPKEYTPLDSIPQPPPGMKEYDPFMGWNGKDR